MCGIFGGTKKSWDYEGTMDCLHHRGPDSRGINCFEDITLGFTRLAIMDLSENGNQPMQSFRDNVWIVFNGEIYGYKNLRTDLAARGHRFRGTSDTEVILNAYLEWGDDFVDHVDGMFAIAIYDQRTCELKLFRDRVGIKPLFYFWDGKEFAFASELKGISRLCTDIVLDHDETAFYDFLTYGYIPEPKTCYKTVFKLLPAHQLTFDLREKRVTTLKRYWQLPCFMDRHTSIEEASEELRELIGQSVAEQLLADVPVGCFLSGGMDSSTLVAEASRIKSDLKTFCVGFEDEAWSETRFARLVGQHFNVQNREEVLSPGVIRNLFQEQFLGWFDEPYSDLSALPAYTVARLARRDVEVVLSGDGADELFGGYPRYQRIISVLKRRSQNKLVNASLRKMTAVLGSVLPKRQLLGPLEMMSGEDLACYTMITCGMTENLKTRYAREWGIPERYDSYWYYRQYYREDLPLLTRLQYLDFHTYLPSDILTKIDRVTMAVSLEARVPFLSRSIVEFAFSLPEKIRFYNPDGINPRPKGVLKEAYKDIVPTDVIARRKMGFAVPPSAFDTVRGQTIEQQILAKFLMRETGVVSQSIK